MAFQMITTAERGWFFVQTDKAQMENEGNKGHPVMFRVAAWALTEKGNVVGLIAPAAMHHPSGIPTGVHACLHLANENTNGEYKHYNDLTLDELAHLGSDANRPNRQNL